jgi:gliding motility-associated-like protein
MKSFISLVLVLLFSADSCAQSVSDCNGAIQLCEDVYTEANATSTFGTIFEPTGACNNGTETSSMWYTFTVTQSGNMGFILDPSDVDADYDWGMFNITDNGCAGIMNGTSPEVSCNSFGLFFGSGPTGISTANGGSGNSNGPGDLNGPTFNGDLNVVAGQTYALVVMNWSNSSSGYSIDFSNSTASLFDDINPTIINVTTDCNSPGVVVEFDENLVTTSIQPVDFQLTGPSGNVTINSIQLPAPNSPGNPSVTLIPTLGNLPPGNYTLSISDLAGYVNDACGNTATGSFDFVVSPLAVSVFAGNDTVICPGTNANLLASGNFTSVQWLNGPATASYSVLNAGNYQVTATLNGCSLTDVVNVSIATLPNWDLGPDVTICADQPYSYNTSQSVLWGNGTTSTSLPVSASGVIYGTYFYLGCPMLDSAFVTVVSPPNVDLGPDTTLCTGASLSFSFNEQVTWNSSTLSSTYLVNSPGLVIASYSDGVCNVFDSILISFLEPLVIPIGNNYTYCQGDTVTLTASSATAEYFLWFDGSDLSTHSFYESGNYSVTVSNSCETVSRNWNMEFDDCNIYVFIPNSFTPNNDGINDVWFPEINGWTEVETLVYNRWGEIIFSSSNPNTPWIGEVRSGSYFAPDGVYSYLVKAKFTNGEAREFRGFVSLIR